MLAEPAYISRQQWKWPISASLLLKIFYEIFFVLCTVMEHTSLCSKIVRKVKLLYMDLWLFWLKNCLREKMLFSHQWLKYGSLGRKSSHKREMLHKQAKIYLLIQKSAEIYPCEIRSLLDYDRGQCAESSYLKMQTPSLADSIRNRLTKLLTTE